MKFPFMSAAVAASVIWGASAGPLSETHAYSAVTAPVFDADEALDTMHDLSETIGPRETGTAKEKEAAEYISNRLRAQGASVKVQSFPLKKYFQVQSQREIMNSRSAPLINPLLKRAEN